MALTEKLKNYSELQVEEISEKNVLTANKIIFITRYSRDIDRFRSFYNVATRNRRKIVVTPKTAYLLSKPCLLGVRGRLEIVQMLVLMEAFYGLVDLKGYCVSIVG